MTQPAATRRNRDMPEQNRFLVKTQAMWRRNIVVKNLLDDEQAAGVFLILAASSPDTPEFLHLHFFLSLSLLFLLRELWWTASSSSILISAGNSREEVKKVEGVVDGRAYCTETFFFIQYVLQGQELFILILTSQLIGNWRKYSKWRKSKWSLSCFFWRFSVLFKLITLALHVMYNTNTF